MRLVVTILALLCACQVRAGWTESVWPASNQWRHCREHVTEIAGAVNERREAVFSTNRVTWEWTNQITGLRLVSTGSTNYYTNQTWWATNDFSRRAQWVFLTRAKLQVRDMLPTSPLGHYYADSTNGWWLDADTPVLTTQQITRVWTNTYTYPSNYTIVGTNYQGPFLIPLTRTGVLAKVDLPPDYFTVTPTRGYTGHEPVHNVAIRGYETNGAEVVTNWWTTRDYGFDGLRSILQELAVTAVEATGVCSRAQFNEETGAYLGMSEYVANWSGFGYVIRGEGNYDYGARQSPRPILTLTTNSACSVAIWERGYSSFSTIEFSPEFPDIRLDSAIIVSTGDKAAGEGVVTCSDYGYFTTNPRDVLDYLEAFYGDPLGAVVTWEFNYP